MRWESSLIETLNTGLGNTSGFELFPNVAKSFSDLSAEAIEGIKHNLFSPQKVIMILIFRWCLHLWMWNCNNVHLCPIDVGKVQFCWAETWSFICWHLLLLPWPTDKLWNLLWCWACFQPYACHHPFSICGHWHRWHVCHCSVPCKYSQEGI